jgi:hypothetical protein
MRDLRAVQARKLSGRPRPVDDRDADGPRPRRAIAGKRVDLGPDRHDSPTSARPGMKGASMGSQQLLRGRIPALPHAPAIARRAIGRAAAPAAFSPARSITAAPSAAKPEEGEKPHHIRHRGDEGAPTTSAGSEPEPVRARAASPPRPDRRCDESDAPWPTPITAPRSRRAEPEHADERPSTTAKTEPVHQPHEPFPPDHPPGVRGGEIARRQRADRDGERLRPGVPPHRGDDGHQHRQCHDLDDGRLELRDDEGRDEGSAVARLMKSQGIRLAQRRKDGVGDRGSLRPCAARRIMSSSCSSSRTDHRVVDGDDPDEPPVHGPPPAPRSGGTG